MWKRKEEIGKYEVKQRVKHYMKLMVYLKREGLLGSPPKTQLLISSLLTHFIVLFSPPIFHYFVILYYSYAILSLPISLCRFKSKHALIFNIYIEREKEEREKDGWFRWGWPRDGFRSVRKCSAPLSSNS